MYWRCHGMAIVRRCVSSKSNMPVRCATCWKSTAISAIRKPANSKTASGPTWRKPATCAPNAWPSSASSTSATPCARATPWPLPSSSSSTTSSANSAKCRPKPSQNISKEASPMLSASSKMLPDISHLAQTEVGLPHRQADQIYRHALRKFQPAKQLLPGADFQGAGFDMLSLWQVQVEDAIGRGGFGTVRVDGGGQREGLLELAGGEALPECGRVFRDGHLDFPLQRNRVLLRGDIHIFRLDSGHRHLQNEAFRRLVQVRVHGAPIPAELAGRDKAVLKQAIHRLTQRNYLVERVVTCQICHCDISFPFLSTILFMLFCSSLPFSPAPFYPSERAGCFLCS